MGKLRDIIEAKAAGQDYNINIERGATPSPVQQEIEEQQKPGIAYYNRSWVAKVALLRGYAVSQDDKKVDGILAALNRKDGHCPCGGTGPQFKCPCKIMQEHGICKCGLFENIPDRQFHGRTTGRIEK